MNSNPKISVIVPVYNTEKYLESSLRSIMDQTYSNLEIICVNDGSTDNSLELLKNLQQEDERIIIIDKENEGQGISRNKGMEKATGEWISFIDSDDTLELNAYEKIVANISDEVDMVHFGIQMLYEEGKLKIKTDNEYYDIKYDGLTEVPKSKIHKIDGSASNKLFKKSVIDQYGIRFKKILYEDFQFSMQYISVIDRIFYMPDKLYNYLRRGGSTMTSTFQYSPRAIDHLYALEAVIDFIIKNNRLEEHKRSLRKLFMSYYGASIKYSTVDMIPQIVKKSEEMYEKYTFLHNKIVKKFENNTLIYVPYSKKRTSSIILQKLFSLNYEYINYKLFKVMRLFNIIIYKSPR